MKNLKYFFLTVFAVCAMSCSEDFLDVNPSDSLPPDVAVLTVDDMKAVLLGAYSQLQNSDYYGRYFVLVPDVMSDDVKQNSQANRAKDWAEYNGGVNDIHGIPEEIWTEVYEAINRANVLINVEVEVPAAVQADADQFKGEAYALRALGHFDLVRVYGQHFGFTGDNSHPGVPIVTSFNPAAEPPRNTVAEVYNAVISDLNTAIGMMSQDRGPGFFSPDAARALLARVYLYMSDWNNAKSMADAVIASAGGLTATESYLDAWADRGTGPDVLFEVINTDTDNSGSNALGRMYINEGYGDYLPSDDVYDLMDPDDLRKQLFKVDSTIGGGEFGFRRMNKFPDVEGRDNTPVLRLAETYLIRAEANAMLGSEAAAIDDLMAVRSRAWPTAPPVTASGQALLDEIEKEKRIELMFEGHRLWELMRKKKSVIRNNCTVPPDLNACTITYPDPRFVLPIPKEELNANPNMTQNQGY